MARKKRSWERMSFSSPVKSGTGSTVKSGSGSAVMSRGFASPSSSTPPPRKKASTTSAPLKRGPQNGRQGPRGGNTPLQRGPSTRGGKRGAPVNLSSGPPSRAVVVGVPQAMASDLQLMIRAGKDRNTLKKKRSSRALRFRNDNR